MPFLRLTGRATFRFILGCVSLFFMQAVAHAAVVTHNFQSISGTTWTVDLTVVNDGVPAQISGFTVFFDESLFGNLLLSTSPASWNSLLIPPDLGLPAAGFLDAFVLDPSQALLDGQSQTGFTIQFDFLGTGPLPSLSFDIVDESYSVLTSGLTVSEDRGNSVPEPGTAWLLLASFVALTAQVRTRRNGLGRGESRVAPGVPK